MPRIFIIFITRNNIFSSIFIFYCINIISIMISIPYSFVFSRSFVSLSTSILINLILMSLVSAVSIAKHIDLLVLYLSILPSHVRSHSNLRCFCFIYLRVHISTSFWLYSWPFKYWCQRFVISSANIFY